ncbi:MAG: hypothetical protein ACRD2N_08030, partial [Vicinamibacterales bacterium]
PLGNAGEAIFPAYEGWGPLKDGSPVLLIGYFNRNKQQTLDIPIGPDNRIEPGGPDYGQPTHFDAGRQYGVFAIQVPKDFGTKRLTWTLTANGHTSTISFWTNPQYWIDFYKNHANGNEPPVIKFAENGPEIIGPPRERVMRSLAGSVGQPVTLTLWARDQPPTSATTEASPTEPPRGGRSAQTRSATDAEPLPAIIGGRVVPGGLTPLAQGGGAAARAAERRGDVRVLWKRYRGAGEVKIADEFIALMNGGDAKKFLEATTTATFGAPGEYWLRAQINDSSGDGGGGDQCCWTSAHVTVTIK